MHYNQGVIRDIWWILKKVSEAGLPPLILALCISAAIHVFFAYCTATKRRRDFVVFAFIAYLMLSAAWWHYVVPVLTLHRRPLNEQDVLEYGAGLGIAWGLYRLIGTRSQLLRRPEPRGFEVVTRQTTPPAPTENS